MNPEQTQTEPVGPTSYWITEQRHRKQKELALIVGALAGFAAAYLLLGMK